MPQSIWVAHDNRSHNVAVDYIGKVERLEQCLEEIRGLIGGGMEKRKIDGPIPVLNKSSDGDAAVWSELADNPSIEQTIYRKYDVDFRQFGYARWTQASAT